MQGPPLKDLLRARIAAEGPMRLDHYMAECLLHPRHGYYTTRDPLGADGDFTTAPEISQMFGELIGLAVAQAWLDQGRPPRVTLAELGPGRGTLMADALRATRSVPGFHAAADVVLVEVSPTLRALQALAVPEARWLDDAAGLPDGQPLFLIANEFFDALPIRQFRRAMATTWAETVIGADNDHGLRAGLAPPAPVPTLAHRLTDTRPGDIVEVCPAATPIISTIADRIATDGGAAVIIDYGGGPSLGDTFQALRDHAPVDPFAAPGTADLTAHVDFTELARTARDRAHVSQITPQGVFLERLGVTARARTLAAQLTGDAQDSHVAAHRRLTHPAEMGSLFKVLGITPRTAPMLPGLMPDTP
jgi:SAM-dependent MidA family methyltransferase